MRLQEHDRPITVKHRGKHIDHLFVRERFSSSVNSSAASSRPKCSDGDCGTFCGQRKRDFAANVRAATVTRATLPSKSRSHLRSPVRDRAAAMSAEEPLGRDRQFIDLNRQRGQRVRNGVGRHLGTSISRSLKRMILPDPCAGSLQSGGRIGGPCRQTGVRRSVCEGLRSPLRMPMSLNGMARPRSAA